MRREVLAHGRDHETQALVEAPLPQNAPQPEMGQRREGLHGVQQEPSPCAAHNAELMHGALPSNCYQGRNLRRTRCSPHTVCFAAGTSGTLTAIAISFTPVCMRIIGRKALPPG